MVSDGLIMTSVPPPASLTYNRVITTFVAPEAGLFLVRVGNCNVSLSTQSGGEVGVG